MLQYLREGDSGKGSEKERGRKEEGKRKERGRKEEGKRKERGRKEGKREGGREGGKNIELTVMLEFVVGYFRCRNAPPNFLQRAGSQDMLLCPGLVRLSAFDV